MGVYNNCQSEPNQRQFRSQKVDLHENYFTEMPYFDIALITLDKDATGFIPVCLPNKGTYLLIIVTVNDAENI